MKRITKAHYLYLLAVIAVVTCVVLFFSTGIQFQPRRPENPAGWQKADVGDRNSFIGVFVLSKGESTDNGNIGVRLLNITANPCPFGTICLKPDAKATLRFYRASDETVICEPTLESSSTFYVTSVVCPGLPFKDIAVREINTRDEWALIVFN